MGVECLATPERGTHSVSIVESSSFICSFFGLGLKAAGEKDSQKKWVSAADQQGRKRGEGERGCVATGFPSLSFLGRRREGMQCR